MGKIADMWSKVTGEVPRPPPAKAGPRATVHRPAR